MIDQATHDRANIAPAGDSVPLLSWWLRHAARCEPESVAIEASARLTYAELLRAVERLASQLREAGIGAGDRIAIAANRSAHTITLILAAIEAEVAYVPLDVAFPGERLRAMLDDAQPRVVLGDAIAMQALAAAVPGPLPTLEQPAPRVDGLHAAAADLTYVLFTSGSTGRPKGVAMGSMPLRHLIHWHASHPRLGKAARTLQFAPLSFDVHFQEIVSTVACRGTLVLIADAQRRDPDALCGALRRQRIERLFVPYVALQMIAEASRGQGALALREVISAGEQLQITPAIRELFAALESAELHNHYGPTETHVVTAHELRGDPAAWPQIPPIGRPLPHVKVALREQTAHGSGATGELLLAGDTLAHGYLGRPDLSAERFRDGEQSVAARCYATGDLVRLDADGLLTYLGRADQQLKVDGFRIEPGEIELALLAHESIKDAVVTAPELPGIGKQLVAHVVLREGAAEPAAVFSALRARLRAAMPEYMVPTRYVVLERLPTTPSGKIDRRSLPAPVLEASASPATDAAQAIRSLWQELLGLDRIEDDQNLFDLGARSLLVLRFVARLKKRADMALSVSDVYDRPTIGGLIGAIRNSSKQAAQRQRSSHGLATTGIAIVGMAMRVPGANDVDAFWDNLLEGREGIRTFAPHEIDPSVPESVRSRANFVPARGVIEDAGRFDAGFFGIPAREATVLDPQQRLMLELCWTALEHSGIDPQRSEQRIGVYAGSANNSYISAFRREQPELLQQYGEMGTMLASEKDYVATRVANRLDLHGPALSIHTACSTGLVAVAQAWHALAAGLCDTALAGGSTVLVPQAAGYLHVEGAMESADGHCRPFDADASGTVFSSGGAVVVLKRIEDAVQAGDTIYAVIRGVGLNNDGGDKASFTAPSVSGQAAAIRMALEHAGVDARSIGYVEAHGTGTALGDPIELAALTRAWREDTADNQFCGIGSVKSNLGHLIAAAGVVGLIKAALALHHGVIPRTLHYQRANPHIDFANTPFRVVAQTTPWPSDGSVRRAAISSFGVGGTNAHVVIEEAPEARPTSVPEAARLHLLPVSARTATAAQQRAQDLAEHLERHPATSLADVAATLTRGRKPMTQRLSVVASSASEAASALRSLKSSVKALAKPRVVFLFPGQGAQYPGMARGLYHAVPAFREALDRTLQIAQRELDFDLRHCLVAALPGDALLAQRLAETRYAQPALFGVCYALAVWLDSLGIRPDAMIGHSIGELASACHAGVLSPDQAMEVVLTRGAAMFDQPRGAMLAVREGAEKLRALLPEGIEVAACNAPSLTVVAGAADAVADLARRLEANDIGCTALRVSHAFHSAAMDGALERVAGALREADLHPPRLPFYSSVSGALLDAREACTPEYWAAQVRKPVQFSRAVSAELAHADTVFLEVGPGQALSALVRQHRTLDGGVPRVVSLLGPADEASDGAARALAAVGSLWCAGVDIAWPIPAGSRRTPLPTYPFEGDRYWFKRRPDTRETAVPLPQAAADGEKASPLTQTKPTMSRLPRIEQEIQRIVSEVSGLATEELERGRSFVDHGLDSLALTQATLEIDRAFGVKLRFRRLLEDLTSIETLARFLDAEAAPDKFAPVPVRAALQPQVQEVADVPPAALAAAQGPMNLQQLIQQQMQLMSQQLALLSGQPMAALNAASTAAPRAPTSPAALPSESKPPATAPAASGEATLGASLVDKPFGASPRMTLRAQQDFSLEQREWLEAFIGRCDGRMGRSKAFSQQHRGSMADPRVVTGFNPLWKDLVYPIVVERSSGARLWDLDGNEYIDLLSCFGGNLLGYQPADVVEAMAKQLASGLEVGPQHPLAAEVAELISEFTGMPRVAYCNTGSEAVMGAMRIARTVTGRKTIAIFTNSYHGIFDEVIVRGTRQLRSATAAPGILANAVENILVLDYASDDALRVLRERASDLAAIMIEPIQNKYPTLQPRAFVQSLREICDAAGCALIFDEVVTGFRVAPGGAQEFYGVRADIATYGKVIGGGLPFAAIAGHSRWLDALDGGTWQYGDNSYPEAGVTYFAGTFVRHPLALAAARATLLHLKRGGREFYRAINERTQTLIDRLNTAFAARCAPVRAVHCASLWRLHWDEGQKYVSLFYFLVRYHGLHLYEQFGHFMTEAFGDTETDRVFEVFTSALDELMALGFIPPRGGIPLTRPQLEEAGPVVPKSAPLSPGQTERWLAAGFDKWTRLALNESLCLCLQGPVDATALKAALNDVLQRHEAFRVHFDLDQPTQSLAAPAPIAIAEHDLRSNQNAERALDEFCVGASRTEFALERAPLAAVSLLHLSDGRTIVHLVACHLVFDGWASNVFCSDLALAYRARSIGTAPAFKPAESPLRFAVEEQARMQGSDGEASLAYWQQVLKDAPPPLALADLTPPPKRTYSADTVRIEFSASLLEQMRAQARQLGATLFQWLLTAVTVSLHRRSGQAEFLVSVPYASQGLDRHGPLIADGVLDLPLRLLVDQGDSGSKVLSRVKTRLMDALEHPLMTQGTAARALGLRSVGNRPALTGVFFNLNPRIDLSGFAPLVATVHEGRKGATLNDLFFNFYEQHDRLTLDLHHSAEWFSFARAQALVEDLLEVCEQLIGSMEAPLDEAPLIDARLRSWNATGVAREQNLRIEQWVSRQAAQTPEAIAVEADGVTLSYRELDSRANRVATVLRARGAGAGTLVGLCLGRGPEMLPALLGVLKTGAAYVPLDPGFPQERLRYMAEDAGLKLVITEAAHADRSGLPREHQLRVDDDAPIINAASDAPETANLSDDAPAYVIYTSGSTGRPKGVVLPHRAVCNFLASMQRKPGLQAADRLLAVTTLSFDIAVLELLLPLVTGARTVLAQRADAMDGEALTRMMTAHAINVMQATPTTWHLLLDAGWRAPKGFKALCGGEPLPPSLAARLREQGIELWNMYGPTETTVWSTVARIEDANRKITIGRPIDNTQVWILDEQLRPCPIGTEGEICIGGSGVATGYYKRPELTAERFVRNRFMPGGGCVYRTGDLGRWREDGAIEHLGRLDFQVKIRGYRIELGEIEARLTELPGVAQAVVVAHEMDVGDTALVAYMVPKAGAAIDSTQLRDALRASLPDYMVPRVLLTLAALPLLPNGKIDRKALPAPASTRAPAPAPAAEPSAAADPMVRSIALAMAQLLGREGVADNDHFFELGGHSLMAAKLSAQLATALGQRPGLRMIFESPTPASLAAAMRAVLPSSASVARNDEVVARADQSTAPLSQMQQRVWFLENLTPGTVVHSIPTGHRLTGPLDVDAFNRAFQMLVQRQPVLRTVVERTPSGAQQRVLEQMPFSLLPLEDLSGLPEAEREPAMRRRIAQLVEIPYDLETGPLFTAHLFRISPQEHGLLFQAHHLIWDAWSFDLLYVDLPELYAACLEQREPRLPALTVSYGDFAAWHNEWMSGAELSRQTRHWAAKLTPLPPALELPVDRARPAAMSGRGGSYQFNLDRDVTGVLRTHAQQSGRTLYVTLLAAYALVLQRLSRQNDFVVGTPVRGREQPALEPLMGFFVNMLPLRMQFANDMPLGDWLRSVHDMVVESFSFPDVPFDHLVRELNVPRDSSRPPVHQVSFSYQDVRERTARWGNVEHQRMPTPMLGAAQDLSLWCVETRNHIEFVFTFNADVLETASVALFAKRLESVLRQIALDPTRHLSSYSVLPESEQELLRTWNATEASYEKASTTVHALIEAQAKRTPDAVALEQPGEGELGYAELDARANRLAHLLRARGIARGSLVGLCLERGLDMIVAQLAILKAGAAYVPLDPSYPSERLSFMAQDSNLGLLITHSELVQALDWPRQKSLMLDFDASSLTAGPGHAPSADPALDARPEDPAYVIYTSGSTGKPKGVIVPHRAVVNFLVSMQWEPGLTGSDKLLAVTTLSFDIAVLELLLPLTVGASVVLAGREHVIDGHELLALLEASGANVMQATPTTWRILLDAGWQGHSSFKALIGGEALPLDLAQQLTERVGELWNMYGPTETTVWSTCWRVQQPQQGISIGKPIANTQVHVLDEDGQPCPVGVAGEIYIGGDGVTLGYLQRPALTSERFVDSSSSASRESKLYRTGDRGRWRHDGQLEHLGRLDLQVKVRGHRIELGEIESALARHPDVARAVVALREADTEDARLVAYVVPKDQMPSAGDLREHLRAMLPEYMLPQQIVRLDAVPLLPNGKIDRRSLPAPAEAAAALPSYSIVAPSTSAEVAVAEIWKRLLGIDQISATDNFFDLGGHSLLAMRAVTEIEKRIGVRVHVRRMIFENLAQIASSPAPEAAVTAEALPQASGWLNRVMGKLRS